MSFAHFSMFTLAFQKSATKTNASLASLSICHNISLMPLRLYLRHLTRHNFVNLKNYFEIKIPPHSGIKNAAKPMKEKRRQQSATVIIIATL